MAKANSFARTNCHERNRFAAPFSRSLLVYIGSYPFQLGGLVGWNRCFYLALHQLVVRVCGFTGKQNRASATGAYEKPISERILTRHAGEWPYLPHDCDLWLKPSPLTSSYGRKSVILRQSSLGCKNCSFDEI